MLEETEACGRRSACANLLDHLVKVVAYLGIEVRAGDDTGDRNLASGGLLSPRSSSILESISIGVRIAFITLAIHVQVILRRVRDQWTVVGGVQDRVVVIIRVDAVGQTIDIGIDKSIIDCPVTVVVQSITSFRRWRAGGARVDARVTRTDGGALSEAAGGGEAVHRPVAVIVGAVAGLGGGTQQRVAGVAGEDAGGAGLDTGIAGAETDAAGGRLAVSGSPAASSSRGRRSHRRCRCRSRRWHPAAGRRCRRRRRRRCRSRHRYCRRRIQRRRWSPGSAGHRRHPRRRGRRSHRRSGVQVSAVAPNSGSQVSPAKTPAAQVSTPVLPAQKPTPQVVAWVSGSPAASSSARPSQSSSVPLQVSEVAPQQAGRRCRRRRRRRCRSRHRYCRRRIQRRRWSPGSAGHRRILVGEAVAVIVGQVAGLGRGPQ